MQKKNHKIEAKKIMFYDFDEIFSVYLSDDSKKIRKNNICRKV